MTPTLTSHEFAYQLRRLATVLLSGPDVSLNQLNLNLEQSKPDPKQSAGSRKKKKQSDQAPDIIRVYVELSSIKKSEWLEMLDRAQIPLTFRPRDAARDVLGRLFVYLKDNPEALERLRATVQDDSQERTKSTQLSSALRTLLDLT